MKVVLGPAVSVLSRNFFFKVLNVYHAENVIYKYKTKYNDKDYKRFNCKIMYRNHIKVHITP